MKGIDKTEKKDHKKRGNETVLITQERDKRKEG